jgi:hypothetical protein
VALTICSGALSDWIDWSPTVFVPLHGWIAYEGPNENDNEWWYRCLCTAYDGRPTQREAVEAGEDHGEWCRKGAFRYDQGWRH